MVCFKAREREAQGNEGVGRRTRAKVASNLLLLACSEYHDISRSTTWLTARSKRTNPHNLSSENATMSPYSPSKSTKEQEQQRRVFRDTHNHERELIDRDSNFDQIIISS